MLSAAEATIDQGAKDDAERARTRAKLYAPPPGQRKAGRVKPPGAGMTRAQAQELTRQVAAQDAQVAGRRSG